MPRPKPVQAQAVATPNWASALDVGTPAYEALFSLRFPALKARRPVPEAQLVAAAGGGGVEAGARRLVQALGEAVEEVAAPGGEAGELGRGVHLHPPGAEGIGRQAALLEGEADLAEAPHAG